MAPPLSLDDFLARACAGRRFTSQEGQAVFRGEVGAPVLADGQIVIPLVSVEEREWRQVVWKKAADFTYAAAASDLYVDEDIDGALFVRTFTTAGLRIAPPRASALPRGTPSMEADLLESDIPSHRTKVLRSLVGRRIVEATRYSWWPPAEAQQECGLIAQDVFSLTAGPVEIAFDAGLALGLGSQPSLNSVIVWMERDETGRPVRDEPLALDRELHPVSAADPIFADDFWRQVIGAKVGAVAILIDEDEDPMLESLPGERGLRFMLDSGANVVAAHGLHDNSDTFSIIPVHKIHRDFHQRLRETTIEE